MDTDKLVTENINLVHGVCRRMPYSDQYEDLFGVGALALVRASKRYKPELGYAFSTFAVPYIRGEIMRYLRDVDRHGLRYPRSSRKRAVCISFSQPLSEDENNTLENLIEEHEDFTTAEVEDFISTLNCRQRYICVLLMEGKTQKEIGGKLKISQAQVSRILAKIRKKYKDAMFECVL